MTSVARAAGLPSRVMPRAPSVVATALVATAALAGTAPAHADVEDDAIAVERIAIGTVNSIRRAIAVGPHVGGFGGMNLDADAGVSGVTFGLGLNSFAVPSAFDLREQIKAAVKAKLKERTLAAIELVGLSHATHKYPHEISGGMNRRVALARAIALDPDLVLYDEPFSGLDPIALGTAARLIRDLNEALGLTSLIVSHEIPETFRISDQVIILANGRVAAQGTPDEVRQSEDPMVIQFVSGARDGPVRFHYPGPSVEEDFDGVRP